MLRVLLRACLLMIAAVSPCVITTGAPPVAFAATSMSSAPPLFLRTRPAVVTGGEPATQAVPAQPALLVDTVPLPIEAQVPPPGEMTAAPPGAMVPAPVITGDGPHMPGTRVARTGRIDVYVGLRTFTPEQVAAITPRIERLLRDNEERFGFMLQSRVSLAFYRPSLAPSKDTRGIAYTEEGRAAVFYRPHEDIERALVVASHELAHHLQAQRYGEDIQKRADIILLEGLATWITGPPWLAMNGAESWKARARQIRDMGVPLRLLQPQRYGSDIAYELWASFVDFLIERDGMEKLHLLYASGRSREPGSSDYEGVYGASLDELADEWRAWVGN